MCDINLDNINTEHVLKIVDMDNIISHKRYDILNIV